MLTAKLIAPGDLKAKGIRYSRVTLWRKERDGIFPKRVYYGPARFGYIESEIDAYLRECIARRGWSRS